MEKKNFTTKKLPSLPPQRIAQLVAQNDNTPQEERTDEGGIQEELDPAEKTFAPSDFQKDLSYTMAKTKSQPSNDEDPTLSYLKNEAALFESTFDPVEASFLKKAKALDSDMKGTKPSMEVGQEEVQELEALQQKLQKTKFDEVVTVPKKDRYDQVQLDTWMSPLIDRLICAPFVYPCFILLLILFHLTQERANFLDEMARLKLKLQGSCLQVNHFFDMMESWPSMYILHLQSEAETVLKMMIQQFFKIMQFAIGLGKNIMWMLLSSQTTLYKCLASTVLTSSTQFLVDIVQTLQHGWNDVISNLEKGFSKSISSINDQLSSFLGSDFTRFFGLSISTKVQLPNISQLAQSLQVPTGFTFDVQQALASMPSLDTIEKEFENVLASPFQLLSQALNTSLSQLESSVQLNFTTNALPMTKPEDLCNEVELIQLLNHAQTDLDRTFLYSIYAILGCLGLSLIYSMIQVVLYHHWTKTRIQTLSTVSKADMIWELLDPITYKIVQWVDKVVCLVQRYQSAAEVKATRVNAHLSRGSKRSLARVFRFLGYPPAVVFLLFCFTTLSALYFQLSLVQKWKQQPELILTPLETTFQNLASKYSLNLEFRIQNAYSMYLNELNHFSQEVATRINNVIVNQYLGIVTSINGTLDGITSQMMQLIDQTFSQVPAIQVTLTDLLRCFLINKTQRLQDFLNEVLSATTFKPPEWSAPSSMYLKNLAMLSGNTWSDTSTGLVLDFLAAYENKLYKQITFAWYMTLFAFGPGIYGLLFVMYTYGIQKIPWRQWKQKTQSRLSNTHHHEQRLWTWHAKKWNAGKKLNRAGLVIMIIVFLPLYSLLGLVTIVLYPFKSKKPILRRAGKKESRVIAKKDMKLAFQTPV